MEKGCQPVKSCLVSDGVLTGNYDHVSEIGQNAGTARTFYGALLPLARQLRSSPLSPPVLPGFQVMYVKFEEEIEKLNQLFEEQACDRPGARRLTTRSE